MTGIIGWEEPREPVRHRLMVSIDGGPTRYATEADLAKAGFVKQPPTEYFIVDFEPKTMTVDEVRQAEAWRKIDKWALDNASNSYVMVTPLGTKWSACARRGYLARSTVLAGPIGKNGNAPSFHTKLEALEALATWCEGQAGK